MLLILQRIWIWIKHYWYVPVIAIVLLVSGIVFGKGGFKLLDMLQSIRESYQNQINDLEELNEEEGKKKEDLQLKYEAIVKQLEEVYASQSKILEEEKKKEIEKLVKEKSDEELTQLLKEKYGL